MCLAAGLLLGQMHPGWCTVPPVQLAQSPLLHGASGMSAVALSGPRLAAEGTFLYQAGFDAARWSGRLKKFALGLAGDGSVQVADTAEWDAADILSGSKGVPPSPLPEAAQDLHGRIRSWFWHG